MNVFDISDTKEKIIHILYAGYVCGYYNECISECESEYGKKITKEGKIKFEEDFMSTSSKI